MILIAGAGAIGQMVAARLVLSGQPVQCLVRDRFVTPLQNARVHGKTEYEGPLDAVTEPAGPYDIIIITAKAHQTHEIAAQLQPHLAPDGTVVSIQNGLGNQQKLERFFDAEQVVVGLTSQGATIQEPGVVYHAGLGPTKLGGPRAEAIAELLAPLQPTVHEDIREQVWTKAIVNAALNPLGAIFGCKNGEVYADPDRRALAKAITAECWALATKARVDIPDPWPAVESIMQMTADNKCSMLQDVEAKRPTEIEQITGRLVRLGELLLVSMPKNDYVYGRLKDLERSYLGSDSEEMAFLELEWARDPF
ncbi:MAG: ketopantoate reductase family protein [Thermoplasmatota archaeon]